MGLFQSTRPHGARPDGSICVMDECQFQSTRPHGARRQDRLAGARHGVVSIHAPARGATTTAWREQRHWTVSIHAPARGATNALSEDAAIQLVSIHAPTRGATIWAIKLLWRSKCFNPRARTGRDDRGRDGAAAAVLFQSTRPHGARPAPAPEPAPPAPVSIHAPARGATGSKPSKTNHYRAFQSTRPHGARLDVSQRWRATGCFNPRARTGRDRPWLRRPSLKVSFNPRARTGRDKPRQPVAGINGSFNPRARTGRDGPIHPVREGLGAVSIHAPARGATRAAQTGQDGHQGFNPRARTGRDRARLPGHDRLRRFNPRARTGRDILCMRDGQVIVMFQSTRPHGARQTDSEYPASDGYVSIHAPARGATGEGWGACRLLCEFQSTRPHGARRAQAAVTPLLGRVSIHAPARGATVGVVRGRLQGLVSIHAPARGATVVGMKASKGTLEFQSTRPHGARPT